MNSNALEALDLTAAFEQLRDSIRHEDFCLDERSAALDTRKVVLDEREAILIRREAEMMLGLAGSAQEEELPPQSSYNAEVAMTGSAAKLDNSNGAHALFSDSMSGAEAVVASPNVAARSSKLFDDDESSTGGVAATPNAAGTGRPKDLFGDAEDVAASDPFARQGNRTGSNDPFAYEGFRDDNESALFGNAEPPAAQVAPAPQASRCGLFGNPLAEKAADSARCPPFATSSASKAADPLSALANSSSKDSFACRAVDPLSALATSSSKDYSASKAADPLSALATSRSKTGGDSAVAAQAVRSHDKVASAKMDKFITRRSGTWSLQGGQERRTGSYAFNSSTGILTDASNGAELGWFSCDPISDQPLPLSLDEPGEKPLKCIGVVDSEIMKEIQDPRNAGAYFVLPSQLNGAEYPAPSQIVQRIENYKFDNTGGPRGQLAVHPAAGQFVLDNAASETNPNGINAVDQILEKCVGDFRLRNGYLELPRPTTDTVCTQMLARFRNNIHTLRPLVMAAVPATGLIPSKGGFSLKSHNVHLVYASAVPFEAYMNTSGRDARVNRLHCKVAEAVLVAQYYGALKTAASRRQAKGKDTVFMLPLGGGVFNNPWESIAKAMSLAVEMLTEQELAKLDIQVLTWTGNSSEKSDMCRLLTRHNKLAE